MEWLELFDRERFVLFTLVLTRISGLVLGAPVLNSAEFPMRFRALLTFAVALMILPSQAHASLPAVSTVPDYLVLVGGELLIGLALGLSLTIFLSGIQLGGLIIGRTGGMLLASGLDPTSGEEMSTFSRILHLTALAVFVCIGGHRLMMAGLLDTFEKLPIGGPIIDETATTALIDIMSASFRFGVRSAMPVTAALLLSTLVMGLISRAVPQLNILLVGFGLNAMLTFLMMTLTVGATVMLFCNLDTINGVMGQMLQALGC